MEDDRAKGGETCKGETWLRDDIVDTVADDP